MEEYGGAEEVVTTRLGNWSPITFKSAKNLNRPFGDQFCFRAHVFYLFSTESNLIGTFSFYQHPAGVVETPLQRQCNHVFKIILS